MDQIDLDALKRLASKYVWWKTPDEAIEMPDRVIAQVMNIGDYADVQQLVHQVGDDVLRDVIAHAQAGAVRPGLMGLLELSAWTCQCRSRSTHAFAEIYMTGVFKPRMGILPPAQQRLWPELRPAAELGFALYGGTAIAPRLYLVLHRLRTPHGTLCAHRETSPQALSR